MKSLPKVVLGIILMIIGVIVIGLAVNIGVWYSDSKYEPVEISEPTPAATDDAVPVAKKDSETPPVEIDLPSAAFFTSEEIAELPYSEQPLGAGWYETYANIIDDPTGYKKGVDYTPVVPYILEAMKEKGYLSNADWKVFQHQINIVEAVPERKRINAAMAKAREKMNKAMNK